VRLATKTAMTQKVQHSIRVVGSVVADERREAHVHTRVAGWIDDISVSAVGTEVKRGQVLYRLYAPELAATQQELLAARRQGDAGRRLADAAVERLSLWNVAPFEIEALQSGAAAKRALAFVAPTSGYVLEKTAVKGAYVTPEMELYRIADVSKVWIVVSLYENELPLVAVGDVAEVTLTSVADHAPVRAPVSFIYPELDTATRTGRARIEVDNRALAFKPGMFASVTIEKDLGVAVVIPEDALLFTGQRNLVFKKMGATRFVPVEVTVGPRVQGGRVVLAGVQSGDEVVVRASFLIDAESRLQAALDKGGAAAPGHAGHGDGG
jgi:membrane fusion protein, copper/silver efflux system